MAEYKSIKGFKVQSLAADPSGPQGQVWYNTTTSLLKFQGAAGAWAAGNNLNTRRSDSACAGTNNASLVVCGGYGPFSPGPQDPGGTDCETYDGTSFSTENDMNNPSSYNAAAGTATAALNIAAGASPPSGGSTNMFLSETWDGTCWTNANDMNTGRQGPDGAGATSTAALAFSGTHPENAQSGWTESYDGTSWTSMNNTTSQRRTGTGMGIQTVAIFAGGTIGGGAPGFRNLVENWDGTSWAAGTAFNHGRANLGSSHEGSPSTALIFGGQGPAPLTLTESWNGSAWTEVADMATACYGMGSGGTGNDNAIAIDANPSPTAGVEIWTFANTVKTVTVS